MGYIMDLRKVVGHRPLIMTCAGVLGTALSGIDSLYECFW